MSANGAVEIQGCAYRVSRLNADGSIVSSSVAMVQDDRSLVKLELKPELYEGKEFTPESACGVPVISYKDCNRYKRWNVSLTLGDWDPEKMELIGDGSIMTAPGSSGRTFADGVLAIYENTLLSAADASFTADDVGRAVTDAGFTVADCTTATDTSLVTSGDFISDGVVPGMTVTGTHIAAGTTVVSVESATSLTLSQATTGSASSLTMTFYAIPAGTFVFEYVSATEVRMSEVALSTFGPGDITLGAQPVTTIGYVFPKTLLVPCPNGFSIEVWSKLITRGTGYQGTVPYPSAGSPSVPPSPYVRTGVFRAYVWHEAFSIEDKENTPMFTGWTSENPNFGTGPADDWRVTALPAVGDPVDTSTSIAQMADFELPAPLQAGYQPLPIA